MKKNRLRIGDIIDFSLCDEIRRECNHIFFKKDGGWGIASKEGEILLSNRLTYPFNSCLGYIDKSLCVAKDVDTGLYGVISKNKAKEIVPFKFTYIETLKVDLPERKQFLIKNSPTIKESIFEKPITCRNITKKLFFKVNKGGTIISDNPYYNSKRAIEDGLWGVYDESGNMLINARYYNISFISYHFECRSTEDYKEEDYGYNNYGSILSYRKYVGKIDLFNLEGDLIVGGVDLVAYHGDYIIIYLGIKYYSLNPQRNN